MACETITSRDNARLANARKVRDAQVRDAIFIEGRRLVEEALRAGAAFNDAFAADTFEGVDLLDAVASRCEVHRVAERLFASIADTANSQGIIVIAQRPVATLSDIDVAAAEVPLVLLLHEINNPSNLGAVFRTAEAAGIAGVITSPGSADAFSPKAMRSAMGANLRLPVVEAISLHDALQWARDSGLVASATASLGDVDYVDVDWRRPRLLVLGSEAHGLSAEQLAQADETVGIPMAEPVESLNLAVSAGIILFEAKRQVGD